MSYPQQGINGPPIDYSLGYGGGNRKLKRPTNSMELAQINDVDMNLVRQLLSSNKTLGAYLAHTRIVEDAKYSDRRPPDLSPQANKKDRVLILTKKQSGRMSLLKTKYSESSGILQHGRTWDLMELKEIIIDDQNPNGLSCKFAKYYYWEVPSPKERRKWSTKLLESFIIYTNGGLPTLTNCSLEYFHLEGFYKNFQEKRNAQRSITNTQSSAHQQQIQGHQSPTQKSAAFSSPALSSASAARSATAAALTGGISAGVAATSSAFTQKSSPILNDNETTQYKQDVSTNSIGKESSPATPQSQKSAKVTEFEANRQAQLAKRRQREHEIREREKAEAQERERLEKLELEKLRLEEEERAQTEAKVKAKAEAQAESLAKAKAAEKAKLDEDERKRNEQLEKDKIREQNIIPNETVIRPTIPHIQTDNSFDIGDESRFQTTENPFNSDDLRELDNFIQKNNNMNDTGYMSDDGFTAPLNLKPSNTNIEIEKSSNKSTSPLNFSQTQSLQKQEEFPVTNQISLDSKKENQSLMVPSSNSENLPLERVHSRSRAFSRVTDHTPDNSELFTLLESIGYDPLLDDSESLKNKLRVELEALQYKKIQTITEVTSATFSLKSFISTSFKSCDHIDPILALFGVQLSFFKDDVEDIENQGQGLQVTATNEKLLMNELNSIVNSVDLSNAELQMLRTRISLGYQNSQLEGILSKLYTGLIQISGTEDNEDAHGLSNMQALQEKKNLFISSRDEFIYVLKKSCDDIFRSVSLSLSSKLENVNFSNFDSKFLKTSFIDKSASLISLNGLIAFVKRVSVSDYKEITNSYIENFRSVFENVAIILLKELNQKCLSLKAKQFSFNLSPADLIDKSYMDMRNKKVDSKQYVQTSEEGQILILLKTFFLKIINLLAMEQELIKQLFCIYSSPDLLFENLIGTALEARCEQFTSTADYFNGSIEADGFITDDIYDFMKSLFDQVFSSTLSSLVDISKTSTLTTPAIICLIESLSASLSSTNNEYSYSNVVRLKNRVTSIWSKEIDHQFHAVMSHKIECHVLNYMKAYSIFFDKIHLIIGSLEMDDIPTYGLDDTIPGNYYMTWDAIRASLNNAIEHLKIDVQAADPTSQDYMDNNMDTDTNVIIQRRLTLLINYKWIFEETKHLRDFPRDLSKSIDDLREKELRAFIDAFARKSNIGNIIRLSEDLEKLSKNDTDPAHYNSYSLEHIKNMMVPFKDENLTKDIKSIGNEIRALLKGRCFYSDGLNNGTENEYSIAIGESIEKELYNQCTAALCQLYLSTFTKISNIGNRFYDNFDVPVDKSVITYSFKKYI